MRPPPRPAQDGAAHRRPAAALVDAAGRRTRTPSWNCAPAAIGGVAPAADRARAASGRGRPGRARSVPRTLDAAVAGDQHARRADATPPRRRRAARARRAGASAPGLSVSPHSLSRGKRARSTSRTRAPARASRIAAIDPAGPAPAISTSTIASVRSRARPRRDDGAVLRSEAEAVAERGFDLRRPARVGDEVEIAGRIGIALVDRRRQHAAVQRQRGGDEAAGAARALRMADHRLGRRSGHAARRGCRRRASRTPLRWRRSAASTCRDS